MKTTNTTSTTLAHILLSDVALSETNKMFRDENELHIDGLQEIIGSVREKGVIQPILLRANPTKSNKYILVCGERRFRAATAVQTEIKDRNTIPAYVRAMSEAEALELQITENLQRKDIHPLKEARAFSYMIQNVPNTTSAELALRFGKSETYILQRLKLNDLTPEARKDFMANRMSLGHALLLARLTPENQKEALDDNTNTQQNYGTVLELEQYINRHIICNLADAPFDTKDEQLIPKAGACGLCPKRSGCSPMLFADIKQKNLCVDKNCFLNKAATHLTNVTKEVIVTEPATFLLRSYSDPCKEIQQLIDEYKVKPLKEYDDFEPRAAKGAKVQGLWISGQNAGKRTTIRLKQSVKGAATDANASVSIARVQERLKRAQEIDAEKVHMRITDQLAKHPFTQKKHGKKLYPEETSLLWFLVFDNCPYTGKKEIEKTLGLKDNNPEHNCEQFSTLSEENKAFILRTAMREKYLGKYPTSTYGHLVRNIAAAYKDIQIDVFEKEQADIRTRRIARAKEKINALQSLQKKQKPPVKK